MTFIEITLAVSLIAIITLALYKSLANGLLVWSKARELVIEEDISIFFDKLAHDLRNTYVHTTQHFEGDGTRVTFPSLVWLPAMNPRFERDGYLEQLGQVEYLFDHGRHAIVRRAANYSSVYMQKYDQEQVMAAPIERIQLTYYYLTDDGEVFSEAVLGTIPAGMEVEVFIDDGRGRRSMKRYFNIPLKI
jgi:hypothetical protein